jgi:hypothetical protein
MGGIGKVPSYMAGTATSRNKATTEPSTAPTHSKSCSSKQPKPLMSRPTSSLSQSTGDFRSRKQLATSSSHPFTPPQSAGSLTGTAPNDASVPPTSIPLSHNPDLNCLATSSSSICNAPEDVKAIMPIQPAAHKATVHDTGSSSAHLLIPEVVSDTFLSPSEPLDISLTPQSAAPCTLYHSSTSSDELESLVHDRFEGAMPLSVIASYSNPEPDFSTTRLATEATCDPLSVPARALAQPVPYVHPAEASITLVTSKSQKSSASSNIGGPISASCSETRPRGAKTFTATGPLPVTKVQRKTAGALGGPKSSGSLLATTKRAPPLSNSKDQVGLPHLFEDRTSTHITVRSPPGDPPLTLAFLLQLRTGLNAMSHYKWLHSWLPGCS